MLDATVSGEIMASQMWRTRRRQRRLMVVALLICAVTLIYLGWTSISGHVNDIHEAHSDLSLQRAVRHQAPERFQPAHPYAVSDHLHQRDKLRNSFSKKFRGSQAAGDSERSNNATFRGTGEHVDVIQQSSVVTRQEPVEDVSIRLQPGVTGDFPEDPGRIGRDQRKPRNLNTSEAAFWPEKYHKRRARHRGKNATFSISSLSHYRTTRSDRPSQPRLTTLQPTRIVYYITAPREDVETFREPEVVIRAELADLARNRRVSPSGGVGSEYGATGGKRSPLLGSLHGGPGNCHVYNTLDDLPELQDFAAGVDCIDLATTPSVVVCPYPDADDRHLSRRLRTHGVWEPHIVRLFQAALLTNRQLCVYDVGANIGQYSLLAAAMGRQVVSVELYRPNIYRLHKAIRLGRFEDKITVVENGVSDERDTFELEVTDGDPSGVRLTTNDADRYCDEPGCPPHVGTILLDDLLEVTNFAAAVMKMDVEGYEHRAFANAEELLSDVHVPYIFMEWTRMRELYGSEADDTADKRLVQRMVNTLVGRNYTAYSITELPLRTMNPQKWYAWPHDILWVLAGSAEPNKLADLAPEVPSTNLVRRQ